jgi:hypothetical protein
MPVVMNYSFSNAAKRMTQHRTINGASFSIPVFTIAQKHYNCSIEVTNAGDEKNE